MMSKTTTPPTMIATKAPTPIPLKTKLCALYACGEQILAVDRNKTFLVSACNKNTRILGIENDQPAFIVIFVRIKVVVFSPVSVVITVIICVRPVTFTSCMEFSKRTRIELGVCDQKSGFSYWEASFVWFSCPSKLSDPRNKFHLPGIQNVSTHLNMPKVPLQKAALQGIAELKPCTLCKCPNF